MILGPFYVKFTLPKVHIELLEKKWVCTNCHRTYREIPTAGRCYRCKRPVYRIGSPLGGS